MQNDTPNPQTAGYRIPSWKVADATKALAEDQARVIRWLHADYYESNRSLGEIGAEIGLDGGTVSKVFSGKYEGNMENVCEAIERYRRLKDERATVQKAPYIETSLYREIEEVCQATLTYQKMSLIFAESQIGKTAAAKHYAKKHNHGETVYVEMPPGGSLSYFLAALASASHMGNSARGDILQLNIMKNFGPNNLLIVDETMRALQAKSYGGTSLKTMDFIRSLHDTTGCGVVLIGTNVFRDQMRDQSLKKFLNQFNRRCLIRRQLNDVPTRGDLNLFARHYALEAATGEALQLQRSIVTEHGLGVWLTTLVAANRRATKQGKALTWEHVIKAHAFFRSMEQARTEREEGGAA